MKTSGRPWDRTRREPRPEPKDIDRWRRLVKLAGKGAARPMGDMAALGRAADRARKAIMPVGHQHGGSPFVQLLAAARMFGLLDLVARQRAAPDLASLASACVAILDPPAAPPPPRRTRADVDG